MPAANAMQVSEVATTEADQFVTVGVGDELFAINVAHVREVLAVCPMTRVPNTPPFVRGIVDVRGKGVPVIDMRARFGLPPTPATEHTRIVVLEVTASGRPLVIGAMTDRVYEVTSLDAGDVEPPPDVGLEWRSEFIRGIGRRGERFVIVLNLDSLFESDELAAIAPARGSAENII